MHSTADPPVPQDRLYGRRSGHSLRDRQRRLLNETLPRLRHDPLDPSWPARFNQLWLEIGFGSGEHAQTIAAGEPGAALIACEVFTAGICSLLGRLVAQGAETTGPLPANLRVWDQDARTLLRQMPPQSLDRLFLLFPDPWPKSRHAARRFIGPEMVGVAATALRPGADWRVASDDPTYQNWVTTVMAGQTLFTTPPPATTRPAGWPPTRYEAKALRAGRAPLYWTFTRIA